MLAEETMILAYPKMKQHVIAHADNKMCATTTQVALTDEPPDPNWHWELARANSWVVSQAYDAELYDFKCLANGSVPFWWLKF